MTKKIEDDYDTLVPDAQVARELGITVMSVFRYTQDPTLGFPAQVKLNRRNYRSRKALEEFKARLMKSGIVNRSKPKAKASADVKAA